MLIILEACSKDPTNVTVTPGNEKISTELQNLIANRDIHQVVIGTLGTNSSGKVFDDPVKIEFNDNFLIINTINYFALDKITQFYIQNNNVGILQLTVILLAK